MPNLKITSLLASVLLFSPMPASAELSSLKVTVTNAATTTGTIEVTLFDSSESFLKEVYLQQGGAVAENGTFIAEFFGLEEGWLTPFAVVHEWNAKTAILLSKKSFAGVLDTREERHLGIVYQCLDPDAYSTGFNHAPSP